MTPKTVKKKGNINRYGFGVTAITNGDGEGYWWVDGNGWVTYEKAIEIGKGASTHYSKCRTLRAFRRHVRKHCGHMKNVDIIWCQRHGNHATITV